MPALTAAGFSPHVAGLFREMIEGARRGLFAYEHPGSLVTGRVALEEVLAQLAR